jgi:hypothetical protein
VRAAKRERMHDLVVREALETMAVDAAERLHDLIAAGAEIPYEVLEPGDSSPLCEYTPQTGRFVRENAGALRELDSFGAACAALESAGLAGSYLDAAGVDVPPETRPRAELAGILFLCRLWQGSTDFSIPDERLEAAIAEIELGDEPAEDEIEVVVPVRGLQMPIERLELATATLVRADTVEVPPEARAAEGSGAAGWQPTFLAVARVGEVADGAEAPDAGARAVESFRQLVTTLRLFKAGGIGLGPHAWARSGGDRWRRIATGEGRPRPGGYVLAPEDLADLMALSRALAQRSTPFGRPARDRAGLAGGLARAISRFEAGLERHAVLEALNDYLLSLRFLLDGAGPADLGLSMRVAALCAEPDGRDDTKAVLDRALALERELWTGEPSAGGDGRAGPVEIAGNVEELTRAILKDAACGHLGSDLRVTADEILLADGFTVGDGSDDQRGATAEWSFEDAGELEPEWAGEDEMHGLDEDEPELDGDDFDEADELPVPEPIEFRAVSEDQDSDDDDDFEQFVFVEKVSEPEGRITVDRPAFIEPEEEQVTAYATATTYEDASAHESPTTLIEAVPAPPERTTSERVTALLAEHRAEREAVADRVAHLFPAPEPCEWDVPEVGYDRRRRAEVSAQAS